MRIGMVEVQEELVRDSTVRRKAGAKAEGREQFVGVVILDDLANREDSLRKTELGGELHIL